jgi:hypothetical protein
MLFLREAGSAPVRKVVLLQSKRLYPAHTAIREFNLVDYEIGMARLADPENDQRRLGLRSNFEFNNRCKYAAILVRDQQYKAIAKYEAEIKLKVYYALYNPPIFPYTKSVPSEAKERSSQQILLGVRVVSCKDLRQQIDSKPN